MAPATSLRIQTWGKRYIKEMLSFPLNLTLVLLAFASSLVALFKRKWLYLFPTLSFLFFLFYPLYSGGDFFPFFRFFTFALPFGVILIFAGIVALANQAKKKSVLLSIIIVSIVFWVSLSVQSSTDIFHKINYLVNYKPLKLHPLAQHWETWVDIGKWLKNNFPENTSLVVQDIGTIPFYSGLITIDPIALTDSTLAHFFYRNKYFDYYQGSLPREKLIEVHNFVRNYILEIRSPKLILYHMDSRKCDDFKHSFHYHFLYFDPRFQSNYKPIKEFKDPLGRCVYILFSRQN